MITLTGKGVCGGIAVGRIAFYRRNKAVIKRTNALDPELEVKRFEKAREEAAVQLRLLYKKAAEDLSESDAMIFRAYQIILDDPEFIRYVCDAVVSQRVSAEFAVDLAADHFSKIFKASGDVRLEGRAADVRDVSDRLLNILCGVQTKKMETDMPVIIAADDLSPSEAAQLDKEKILAFAMRLGSADSHAAILARTMDIPTVMNIGEGLKREFDGRTAVLDGDAGKLYIEPDEKTMEEVSKKQKAWRARRTLLEGLKGKENRTKNGREIHVYANVGSSFDVEQALRNDAEGIGLFRTEFIYLEGDTFPTEEQQFEIYKSAVEHMGGKRVVIRTLDIGADKQAGYFGLAKEENPALGYRAIRICLKREDIFKTQLRALYRAAAYGQIAVMFPMIISVSEVKRIKEIIQAVVLELKEEGVPFREQVEIGVMIETPAAVMVSRELAKEVDFFSVGTNDLTQYTLAVDRQNPMLDEFYDPHHPAVLSMIQIAADNAHAEGRRIGICGELAADTGLTEMFLNMGIDELSVVPSMVLPLRKKIREL